MLTYVRRGFVRSPVDGEVGPDKLGDDVEDLARLIERHGGPAVVLGSSSGAIVVLELLVRRPDLVRAAIAHEPPLITLLKDRDAIATRFDAVLATYRGEGAGGDGRVRRGHRGGHTSPAARAGAGRDPPGVPRHAGAVAGEQRVLVRARVRPPYPVHELDLLVLREHAARLVLAVGSVSRAEGQLAGRRNLVLARRLGLTPVEVPGGHLGYLEDPAGFAAALEGVVGLLAWET
ncbi:MAG: hypothetical protein QOE59_5156 [Actinomycetota bacterium]|nr:hypothetical protein [Actinomycetota bacterium]